MLTQVSNIIKNFENISNFEKSIDHRQSVSPKSGMIEKNTLKQNEIGNSTMGFIKASKFHVPILNTNIKDIKILTKKARFCMSQPSKSLCQSYGSQDENVFECDANRTVKNQSKAREPKLSSRKQKYMIFDPKKEDIKEINDCPIPKKLIEKESEEVVLINDDYRSQNVEKNIKQLKSDELKYQMKDGTASLAQSYFPARLKRNNDT